jgi:hypothetical protein
MVATRVLVATGPPPASPSLRLLPLQGRTTTVSTTRTRTSTSTHTSTSTDTDTAYESIQVRYIENYTAIKGPKSALAGTLVAVLAGEEARVYAEAVASQSPEASPGASKASKQLLQAALEAVQEIGAGCFTVDAAAMRQPASWKIVEWDTDEFAGGAYSYLGAGCDGHALDRLKESYIVQREDGSSAGLMAWAGEAADAEWMGSLHAAVRSGQRAANDVVAALEGWEGGDVGKTV